MRATDLAITVPMVDRDQSVAAASRIIANSGKTGVVVSHDNQPIGVITALDVLRLAIPDYVLDDPPLAALLDEQAIHEMLAPLRDKTLAEVIGDGAVSVRDVPEVKSDATALGVASVLVAAGCPVAVIAGSHDAPRRFVTLSAVLEAVLDAGLDGDQADVGR